MSNVTVLRPSPRLVPAPCAEPPFDQPDPTPERAAGTGVQGTLALTFTLPSGVPANPRAWLHVVPAPPAPGGAPAPAGPAGDPHEWAQMLVRGIVEVLAGDRPVTQLVNWTTPGVYGDLSRRARATSALSTAERIARPRSYARRVHVSQPTDDVAEVNATIHTGGRARALAFRLETVAARWVCTVVELR